MANQQKNTKGLKENEEENEISNLLADLAESAVKITVIKKKEQRKKNMY